MSLLLPVPASLEKNVYNVALSAGIAAANIYGAWDAGSLLSYPGSGTKWLDLGADGRDVFIGKDATADTTDPTFTGTAGGMSSGEYWLHDGGDFFLADESNPSRIDNIHKNNALWGCLAAYHFPGSASGQQMFGTTGGPAASNGFEFQINSSEKQMFTIRKGSNPAAASKTADNAVSTGAWHIGGCSIDEPTGSGGGFLYLDGGYDQVSAANTFDATYTSPAAGAASQTLGLSNFGSATPSAPPANTARIAFYILFEGAAPTFAQLDAMYDALAPRFGL